MRRQKKKPRDLSRHVPTVSELMQWRRLETYQRYERRRWQANAWKYGQYRISNVPCVCGHPHLAIEFRSGTFTGYECPVTWWGWLTLFNGGAPVVTYDAVVKKIGDKDTMTQDRSTALAIIDDLRGRDVAKIDQEEKIEIAKAMRTILPVDNKMSLPNVWAYVWNIATTGANPWTQEIYAWQDRDGKLVVHLGYRLTVQYANSMGGYHDFMDKLNPEDYGHHHKGIMYKCTVVPKADFPEFSKVYEMSGDLRGAAEFVGEWAFGIVDADEMYWQRTKKGGKWVDLPEDEWEMKKPPKSSTWDDVARRRALTHALRLKFGSPPPDFADKHITTIDGQETKPGDWADVTGAEEEQREWAKLNAQSREANEASEKAVSGLSDEQAQAFRDKGVQHRRGLLRGDVAHDYLVPMPGVDDVIDAEFEETGPVTLKDLLSDLRGAYDAAKDKSSAVMDGKARYAVQEIWRAAKLPAPDWQSLTWNDVAKTTASVKGKLGLDDKDGDDAKETEVKNGGDNKEKIETNDESDDAKAGEPDDAETDESTGDSEQAS